VHHMEADVGEIWPEIEREKLYRWMEQRAAAVRPLLQKPAESPQKLGVTAAQLKATKVSILQQTEVLTIVDVREFKRPFIAHIHHEKPFTLEVAFELPKPTASDMSHYEVEYQAQCHLHSLSSTTPTQMLEMKTNLPKGESRLSQAKLSKLSLEPGLYDCSILLRGTNPLSTNYFKLPKLNVL
jgi:hypothetical protein